jgi:hypothetical protein
MHSDAVRKQFFFEKRTKKLFSDGSEGPISQGFLEP